MVEFFAVCILILITAPLWMPALIGTVVVVVACFALIVPSISPKDSDETP